MFPQVLDNVIHRLEQAEALDRVAEPVQAAVGKALGSRQVRNLLHGTWLGHPVHPPLTDLPIGCWTSAFFLDLFGGKAGHKAADDLIGLGLLAVLPTAAAGLADWADAYGPDRRLGLVHAAVNVKATTLYGLSYLARRRGRRGVGVALALCGAAAATVGGHLGGHLSFRRGVNVNHNAWHEGPDDWTPAGAETDVVPGQPMAASAGGVDLMLFRSGPGSRIEALADVCSHAGGPLHEGEVADGCVTCPWHGSTFALDDGRVVRGPATAPQPVYETRVEDGTVMVRRKG